MLECVLVSFTPNTALFVIMIQCVNQSLGRKEGNVYLTTHSAHFIYGYMASDIW